MVRIGVPITRKKSRKQRATRKRGGGKPGAGGKSGKGGPSGKVNVRAAAAARTAASTKKTSAELRQNTAMAVRMARLDKQAAAEKVVTGILKEKFEALFHRKPQFRGSLDKIRVYYDQCVSNHIRGTASMRNPDGSVNTEKLKDYLATFDTPEAFIATCKEIEAWVSKA